MTSGRAMPPADGQAMPPADGRAIDRTDPASPADGSMPPRPAGLGVRMVVERAQAGDRDAFDSIVRSHADPIHRLARAILGTDADACDATQETFLSAWRRISTLRDPDLLEPWLRQIAINACRQQLRGRRRTSREVDFDTQPEVAHPVDRSMDDRASEADRFDRAFGRLSVDERAVLVLHHLEDRPVAEIAAALGVRAGAIKSRLFRARAALESALREESR